MKERNIFTVVILSIITFGIYDLYWLVKVKRELNEKTDVHVPTIWIILAPTLLYILGVVALLVMTTIQGINDSSSGTTSTGTGAGMLVAILGLMAIGLVTLFASFYWSFKFAKGVNHYTHGEMSTAVTILLLLLLRFLGLAIMQDKFNEMIAAGVGAQVAAAGAPMGPAVSDQPMPGAVPTPPQAPVVAPPQPPVPPTDAQPPTPPNGQ